VLRESGTAGSLTGVNQTRSVHAEFQTDPRLLLPPSSGALPGMPAKIVMAAVELEDGLSGFDRPHVGQVAECRRVETRGFA